MKSNYSRMARTEIVTVRFDPKLHYAAALAARQERRTVSSLIESAVAAYIQSLPIILDGPTVGDEIESLWDVDFDDRLTNLATKYPHLLTFDEQVLWKSMKTGASS